MSHVSLNVRRAFSFLTPSALGFAACLVFTHLRNPAPVHAEARGSAPDGLLDFQISGIGPASALTIYSPTERKLYVYPAVTQGSSTVNCSFTLHITRLGGPVERQNCTPGPLFQ